MPIAMIARFAELVRAGEGNEHERLALLEGHECTVRAKIAELEESLEVIRGKRRPMRATVRRYGGRALGARERATAQ